MNLIGMALKNIRYMYMYVCVQNLTILIVIKAFIIETTPPNIRTTLITELFEASLNCWRDQSKASVLVNPHTCHLVLMRSFNRA